MLYISEDSNILKNYLKYTDNVYPTVLYKKKYENRIVDVPFIVSENNGIYEWIYIKMLQDNYHYRGLVNAIIKLKYDESEMFAIMLNYMDEPNNDKYKKEFKDLQIWRKHAKDYAKKHFNML